MTTIAFIGLGNMGGPMAANLVQGRASGDRVRPVARLLRSGAGRRAPRSPPPRRTAVRDADVVVTMLPAGKHVVSVWTDILPAVQAGCARHRLLHHRRGERPRGACHGAGERGLASLDAPVSGGVGGAKRATLTFMAGGAKEAFDQGRADPVADGQAGGPLRRGRRRPGRQDLQQHDPRHLDDRRGGGLRARPRSSGSRTRPCSTWRPPPRANAGR